LVDGTSRAAFLKADNRPCGPKAKAAIKLHPTHIPVGGVAHLLDQIALVSIALALACALWIAIDEMRDPQAMAIMNLVWPVTALYFSGFAVWAYYRMAKSKSKRAIGSTQAEPQHGGSQPSASHAASPSLAQVAVGTSHCGAGCMLADVFCEYGIAAAGLTLFGSVLWAEYAIDFAAAWVLGIVFQYFAIKPMGQMAAGQALASAVKADTLSILAFQIGMYGWMALVFFKLFTHPHLTPFVPGYWLMMQVAMICGYATSLPMNWLLIRAGWKEAM
jgi:hypothetical protein